jgi:hypothetical protein
MFDELIDDAAEPAVAAPVPPVAAPPPHAVAWRARRGGVVAHSELSKLRIRYSFAKKAIERKTIPSTEFAAAIILHSVSMFHRLHLVQPSLIAAKS